MVGGQRTHADRFDSYFSPLRVMKLELAAVSHECAYQIVMGVFNVIAGKSLATYVDRVGVHHRYQGNHERQSVNLMW
jgi:alpha-D-ribose 1-methylphosphonate 5-triphosphate diphosphatase PhnM